MDANHTNDILFILQAQLLFFYTLAACHAIHHFITYLVKFFIWKVFSDVISGNHD